jgi:succinate dehydrogenase / fumarate reductase cytochrome b subunit
VALKALMAITGLVMIGFLLMHMYGNLKAFLGAEAFDHYAHWLKTDLLYPLLPQGWFIWIFRFALLACIVAHIYAAAVLTLRAHGARSTKYVTTDRIQQTYAARTMRWGGVIIVGFLVFHLLQFTAQVVTTGFQAGASPYAMLIGSFSQWWLVLAYAIWVAAVCLHVRHGVSAHKAIAAHETEHPGQHLIAAGAVVRVQQHDFIDFRAVSVCWFLAK